jgi:divalent metal cation (Fe/Co/Zn/Cd) transporter
MMTMTEASRSGAGSATEAASDERQSLRRRALLLERLTIGWNTIEGVAALAAGIMAGSVALVAFGLDSMVEIFASSVVLWELRGVERKRERLALRLIGGAYLVVAVYVLWDAVRSLVQRHHASASPAGIALMVATVIAMGLLALGKQRTGRRLGSATVLADARFSLIDGGLALAVLIGLLLNALFGWWWADETLAILIALFAAKEGVEALRGEEH